MGRLIVTCNICDQEIIRIPVAIEYPQLREKDNARLVIAAAADHLVEEHTKEEAAAHLREGEKVFWRTTVKDD